MPVTSVPTSSATVAMETFMTELSRVMRNCAVARVIRTVAPAVAVRVAVSVRHPVASVVVRVDLPCPPVAAAGGFGSASVRRPTAHRGSASVSDPVTVGATIGALA